MDPSTYTGAAMVRLSVPMDATAIIAASVAGAGAMLGDLAPEDMKAPEKVEITDEERREAMASMSSLFGFDKGKDKIG